MPTPPTSPAKLPVDNVWLSTRQAAQMMGVSYMTLYSRIRSGKVPDLLVWRIGRSDWRVRREYAQWPGIAADLAKRAEVDMHNLLDYLNSRTATWPHNAPATELESPAVV